MWQSKLSDYTDAEVQLLGDFFASRTLDARLRYPVEILTEGVLELRRELALVSADRHTLREAVGETLRAHGYSAAEPDCPTTTLVAELGRALAGEPGGTGIDACTSEVRSRVDRLQKNLLTVKRAIEEVQQSAPGDAHGALEYAVAGLQAAIDGLGAAHEHLDIPAVGPYR